MTPTNVLKASIKVCMFDQYGTIVDMQTGYRDSRTVFGVKGLEGKSQFLRHLVAPDHFENSMIDALLGREHTAYREIGHRSLAYVLERAGIDYNIDEVRYLVAQIEKLRPFPDVPDALARLKRRYRLVVLSNGDPDMLETAKHHHGIAFDDLISVAVANASHLATYTKAAEIAGVRMDEVLFVANHAFDCIGAKSAGMRTAFIDRRRRPFGMTPRQPDLLVSSMRGLADAIA
jgi:2-haloacid dehalogenase